MVRPVLRRHHFVEPEWFDELGGWERADNLIFFRRFVEYACARLCEHCSYWCTINELNGFDKTKLARLGRRCGLPNTLLLAKSPYHLGILSRCASSASSPSMRSSARRT